MLFDMKRPCPGCPFRSDVKPYLHPERVEEILEAITDGQGTFQCHKTVRHDDEGEELLPTAKDQHCAGALILLEREKRPNQMMRIAERLGYYNRHALDMESPVYQSQAAMLDAYENAE